MTDAAQKILRTIPNDKVHYPATNQTHYCWHKYNEFVLCLKKNDGDEDACKKARQFAVSLCPAEWVENWDDHRSRGVFLGVQQSDELQSAVTHHH